MKNLIVASSSSIYVVDIYIIYYQFKGLICWGKRDLFYSLAQPNGMTYDQYTHHVSKAFANINISVKGLHEFEDKKAAITNAEGIFTGGGNTFLLLHQLQKFHLLTPIREANNSGTPYLGTSAVVISVV